MAAVAGTSSATSGIGGIDGRRKRTARDDDPGLPGHLGLAPPSLPSTHPTCSESRRTPSRRNTSHCGRVRRTAQHGVRVRGVFLARVPHMLPSTPGGVPPFPGSNHG